VTIALQLCNKHSYLCKLYNRNFLVTILSWEHACTECAWLNFSVTASVDREVICHHIKYPQRVEFLSATGTSINVLLICTSYTCMKETPTLSPSNYFLFVQHLIKQNCRLSCQMKVKALNCLQHLEVWQVWHLICKRSIWKCCELQVHFPFTELCSDIQPNQLAMAMCRSILSSY
jgi:hypothetical protein